MAALPMPFSLEFLVVAVLVSCPLSVFSGSGAFLLCFRPSVLPWYAA